MEARVAASLHDWVPSRTSHFLYVAGPRQATAPNSFSQTAIAICSVVAQAGAPVIQVSCTLSTERVRENFEPASKALINLLYSLIGQLIDVLPENFEINEELSISELDGTTRTFALALRSLKILLDAAPSPLFCIIDNFQFLEDPAQDNSHLTRFLTVLQEHSKACRTAPIPLPVKILFTTSGRSTILMEFLEPHEMVLADQRSAARLPGRSRPGRKILSPTTARSIESLGVTADESADGGFGEH